MITAMTIESFLQVVPLLMLPSSTIDRILLNNNIAAGADVTTISEQTRDIAESEAWFYASVMGGGGSYSKKVGERSVSERMPSIPSSIRESWIERSNNLREKWGLNPIRSSDGFYDATNFWG